MEPFATSIGLVGVGLVLFAYAMLTLGKMGENEPRYYWLNLLGTIGIALSLLVEWNLPSMVTQVLWIAISLIGLARTVKRA